MSQKIYRCLLYIVIALMLFCCIRCNDEDTECPKGSWGTDCDKICEENCNVDKENCIKTTGICPFCKDGFFSKQDKCTACPGECKNTCTSEGCDDCKDGDAYDSWCNKRCENCSHLEGRTCDKTEGKCLGDCKKGFFGPKCDSSCPSNCDLDASNCEKGTGNCPKCKDGFYGNTCEKCPPKCKTCSSDTTCSQCINKENYGSKCESICSSECVEVEGKSSLCSITDGNCFKCKIGKYGPQCQNKCLDENCQECDKETGVCLKCNDSFFNENGKCTQCLPQCATCNDKDTCTSCKDNKYESKCEKDCPSTCLYKENEHCDFVKGTCKECKPNHIGLYCENCELGFWGLECNEKCSEGCDITKGNCEKGEGACQEHCLPLYFGLKCEYKTKTEHCMQCDKNGVCTLCIDKHYLTSAKECPLCPDTCIDQICTEEKGCDKCKDGYYGLMCQNVCSAHCKEPQCDKDSGKCSNCKEFFTGDKCDKCIDKHTGSECTDLCNEHCDIREKNCDMDGGCDKCYNGFFGKKCEIDCPRNCLGEPDLKCEKNTGNCSKCKNGFYGDHCDRSCTDHCEECNKSDGICTKCQSNYYLVSETKTCTQCPNSCDSQGCTETEGCHQCKEEKTFGKFCDKECPTNCKTVESKPFCDRQKGECAACIGNFDGEKCDACIKGKFSANCDKQCGHCDTPGQECNKETGSCLKCQKKYWGEDCNKDCNSNCDTSGINCAQNTGDCSVCVYGFYSKDCKPCSKNCQLECDFNTGHCSKCNPKLWGDICDKQCSLQCEGNCAKESGDCDQCIEGYYGEQCNKNCKGCMKQCSKKKGECDKHECKNTHYSPWNCDQECSSNCLDQKCDLFTGFCKACKGKKWGRKCENEWFNECDKDTRVECNEAQLSKYNQFTITLSNGARENKNEEEDNELNVNKDAYPMLKVDFGSKRIELNILVDFDSNSPLVVFDKDKELPLEEQSKFLKAVYNSKDSTPERIDNVDIAYFDIFESIEGNAFEEIIFLTTTDKKGEEIKQALPVRIIIPYKVILHKDKMKLTSDVNGVIGLGFLSSFSLDLYKELLITKNMLIVSESNVSFGDYTKDIKRQFSSLTTIIPKEEFKYNSNQNIKTLVRGFTSNYGKGYILNIDTTISYARKTELFFPNSLQSYFDKLYFGSLFSNNDCELKDKPKGIKEYICNNNLKFDSLPLIGLVIDDYIYYLNEIDLFEKENERYHFKIQLMKEPKIVLGKKFLNHYSMVYNQGNGTISLFGNTKKLYLDLVEIPKDWPDLSNTGWFTPGTIALFVIFGLLGCFVVYYIASYCLKKKRRFEINEALF